MEDVTRITWVTAALAVFATVVIGRAAYDSREAERSLEIGLFAEDACMRLTFRQSLTKGGMRP